MLLKTSPMNLTVQPDTLTVSARFRSDSIAMGSGLLGYWLLICISAGFMNIISKALPYSKIRTHSRRLDSIRSLITIPTLFAHGRHTVSLGSFGLLPTRLEALILSAFTILVTIFSLSFSNEYQRITAPSTTIQWAHNLGLRTGILSMFTLQLSFLFAGRNNILLWLTGWKQATFLTYHKWISRLSVALVVVHTAAFHVVFRGMGLWEQKKKTGAYHTGIVAICCMILLVIFAAYWIRKRSYELFSLFHILLTGACLLGSFKHLRAYNAEAFVYPILGIWLVDRIIRAARVLAFGVQRAHCQLVTKENIKITIPKRKFWRAFPGAYGYIHFFTLSGFFQSHPFSIVIDDERNVIMYAKIKSGITSSLYHRLINQPDQSAYIDVSVEGPYGDKKPLQRFETILLYAGGNGIPSPYAYARSMSRKQKRVKLYWVIRSTKSFEWIRSELEALRDTSVEVVVYITKQDDETNDMLLEDFSSDLETTALHTNSVMSEDNESSTEKTVLCANVEDKGLGDFIEFRYGRPNITELIKLDLQESSGSVAVMSCGHNKMVDHIRNAVADNLSAAQGRVDYYEELQTW